MLAETTNEKPRKEALIDPTEAIQASSVPRLCPVQGQIAMVTE